MMMDVPENVHTLTTTAKTTAKLEIVVDYVHMKGLTDHDQWGVQVNPKKNFLRYSQIPLYLYYNFFSNLKVNTEVCEQTFSWLSRYSHITRHMRRQTFVFFILYLCDLHNTKAIKKLKKC